MKDTGVFISYAEKDKNRFVLKFAEDLRKKGIDAWIAEWEIKPGDSLVQKIFNEGITINNTFIIILSTNSIDRPWVLQELDIGIIKKINENSRIIPVLIDDVDVPTVLTATKWIDFQNPIDYSDNIQTIVNTILEIDNKPSLGKQPDFSTADIFVNLGISIQESIVLEQLCKEAFETDSYFVTLRSRIQLLIEKGIDLSHIDDSLEILSEDMYVEPSEELGVPYNQMNYKIHFSVLFSFFENSRLFDWKKIIDNIISLIINQSVDTKKELSKKLNINLLVVDVILSYFESLGLVNYNKYIGNDGHVSHVSPKLKRYFN